METINGLRTNVKHFDSPEAYADWLESIPANLRANYDQSFGGAYLEKGVSILRAGNLDRLEDAKRIMDQLDVEGLISNSMPILQSSIAGMIPNIPNAIAGHPETMFSRGHIESPNLTTPLNVYVETTVSAGVSQKELINRGVAILAFALAMETIRPVELYIALPHSHSRKPGVYCPVIKIASRPMDLGRAVWMLTDPCFARRLFHTAINHLSECGMQCQVGPWAWNSDPTREQYETNFRKLLDMQPEDVLLKGGYLTDKLMLTNPVQWVKNMIEKHRGDVSVN